MKKLVAAAIFAAVALAAQSAAACDWNREASAGEQVATTAESTQTQAQPAVTAATQAPTVAAEATKTIEPTPPVVLVTDRH
jgi:spermidine/putrescine-binding protein